ncbi:SDR family NAD(P)-dependent oxidoreductase [Terriglobus saanensis]|uniref:Short-chain dehydrogenase/reductase SDR n=1 Tax=Terriglobus saanensis (strain ATCC BAA-1853 / DSM 23119 / SP1PR4) TaxID=401053 RepID=E8UZ03_TERSS|nr:SDR family oxidoreductase [Terriglobus saanensis]ADV80948.1 short-chain dehydrogenase/reductase SDR [Terriglobus saanensis SP1PR4]
MDLQLKGKKAIVTGGTAGIGLAIARVLIEEGAEVVIPGRSAKKLRAAVSSLPGNVRGIEVDLATADGAATLIAEVPETDILVNNLGIYEPKKFAEITDEEWLHIFEINVLGGIRLSRHYFPRMLEKDSGRVIFISSESGIMTPGEMVHYGMTKTAQLAISRGLAEQTKGTKVTVNTVLPGPTRSEGIVGFLQSLASTPNVPAEQAEREFFEKYRSSSLLQRLIEDREVANLVAYVASPLSSATNGAALRVEGGLLRSIA